MKQIVIIGGGAAGMTAAVAAAQKDRKAKIHILEHKEIVGKKILSTGNGRCNFTNDKMDAGCYHSEHPDIVRQVIGRFGKEETLKLFRSLGISAKSKNGYYYPRSEQAAAVRELFSLRLENLGICVHTGVHVSGIKKGGSGFCIYTEEAGIKTVSPSSMHAGGAKTKGMKADSVKADQEKTGRRKADTVKADQIKAGRNRTDRISADKVILCAGGKAAPALGSDGSGYALAESLGHGIVPVVPALVQLRVKDHPLKNASGVRTDAEVRIYENRKLMGADTGELQITDYGISGIPVFQVSRHAARSLYYNRPVKAEIDFLPEFQEETVAGLLRSQRKRQGQRTVSELCLGVFNKKLVPCMLKAAGIALQHKAGELSDREMTSIVRICKHFVLDIEACNGFAQAQVCAGGVRLKEIDPATMESLCCPGLYLAGEILDADGICGGYNLQWAWAGGYLAGLSAAAD